MCTIPSFVDNLRSFSTVKMSLRVCCRTAFKRDLKDVLNITYSCCSCWCFRSDPFLVVAGAQTYPAGDLVTRVIKHNNLTCKAINFLMRSVLKRDTNTLLTFGHTVCIQSTSSSNMPQFSSLALPKSQIIQALPLSMASIETAYLHNELLSPSDKF